jgi:superfamily I DNA/RNA helicase
VADNQEQDKGASMRTHIIYGPPGTGKTTTLLDEVDAALQVGVDPSRIGFFTFTRKAANEAITRATSRFPYTQDDFLWFRTLHSAAFKLLGLRRDEVMGTSHYRELGAALGCFTFRHSYGATIERPPQDGGLGDRALSIYSLARAKQVSVEQAWREAVDPRISLQDVLRFSSALNEYKKAMAILDFNDFMDHESHGPLDLDLMILDEGQDFTHQQWEFARRIGAMAKRIIIAGDDDQTIFEWSGADLQSFLSFKGEMKVLPRSWRLPQKIWLKVESISRQIKVRRPKSWQAKSNEQGEVHYLDHFDQIPLRGVSSWLLLTRNVYQLPALVKACRDQGVVYQHEGEWSNRAASVRAVVAYERLRRGETLSGIEAGLVVRHISGMEPLAEPQKKFAWNDLTFPFQGRPDWMAALTALGTDEREYIRRLRREGEPLSKPGRVVISTIHGAKGGEADCVMVSPDITKRVMMGMQHDRDQEMRVWYVAASRARERLYLAKPQTTRFVEL